MRFRFSNAGRLGWACLAGAMILSEPCRASESWYLSLFAAASLDGDIDLVGSQSDLDTGLMAGLAAGTRLRDHVLAEIELSNIWHPEDTAAATFVLGNMWLEWPAGAVGFFAGGGLGLGRLAVNLSSSDDAGWGFAYQLGAGFGFRLAPKVDFDIGYEFKAIENADLAGIEADYSAHNLLIGITFDF